jgi:hypothetical protein
MPAYQAKPDDPYVPIVPIDWPITVITDPITGRKTDVPIWPYPPTVLLTLVRPPVWSFPLTTTTPWPSGWPKNNIDEDALSLYSLKITVPATVAIGQVMTIVVDAMRNGVDDDGLNNHYIGLVAGIGTTRVQMKKLVSDDYANSLFFQVTNYTGSKYGFTSPIYLNLDASNDGDTITFYAVVTTVASEISGSESTVAGWPGQLDLSAISYSVLEDAGVVTIIVNRTAGSGGAVGCSYATSDGTASAGSDYTAVSGTLSWADGDVAPKTFTVAISSDASIEDDEFFNVEISDPTGGALLITTTAVVTITNDDIEPNGYVYSGWDGASRLRDSDQYALSLDSWASKSDMPLPARFSSGASSIGMSGYVYGGDDGANLRDCDEYTPSGDSWASRSDMPAPIRRLAPASSIGASGYVYSGYDGANRLQDCDEYTPSGDSWASKSDLPAPGRFSSSASSIGTSGYIYGGYDGSSRLRDCDEYTPSGDSWASKSDLPLPARFRHGASSIGTSGYIYGGDGGSGLQDCDEYTPSGDSWAGKSNMLIAKTFVSSASTIGTSGCVYGGLNASYLPDCDEYIPSLDSWTSKSDMPLPARGIAAASTI